MRRDCFRRLEHPPRVRSVARWRSLCHIPMRNLSHVEVRSLPKRPADGHGALPSARARIRVSRRATDTHFDLVHRLCGTTADWGTTPLFEVDIVLLSVLNRSLDLIDGFVGTYNRWNLRTAAPQVRMQVDNLLRLALIHAAPPHSVSRLLLSGDRLSNHADPLAPPGKKFKLTDARLRDHARPLFPWLDLVYEKASGWVHFSSVHIGVTMLVGADGTLSGRSRATSITTRSISWSKCSGR